MPQHQVTKKIKQTLECKLSDPELKLASKNLAEAINERGRQEAILETFKAQTKAQLTAQDAIISHNSILINTEKQFRSVECDVLFDFDKGIKTIYRTDTGEEIRKESITAEERQQELPAG